jgi:type VI secretion system protein ImpL
MLVNLRITKFRKNNKITQKQLRQHTKQIFNSLKTLLNRDLKTRHYLRTTPWYIIIGNKECGKTTALNSAGLNFSPTEQLNINNLHNNTNAAKYCKWWFTHKAIIVSISQSQAESPTTTHKNQATWISLLKILKKYHHRQNLCGIIITLDLTDLCLEDTIHKQKHLCLLRQYIYDIQQKFAIKIPIYLLFTKCDLLAGFKEFFNDLNKLEREQAWGITCPLDLSADTHSITEFLTIEYDKLITRLNERLLWRLFSEHDPKRRELISYFPQQIQLLKTQLIDFISQIVANGDNQVDKRLHFRGMYFSSAAQSGQPKDFLMATVAKQFNLDLQLLPKQMSNNQSYFLLHLFTKVIFAEQELAGNKHHKNLRKRRLAFIICPSILIISFIGMLTAYTQTKIGINQAEDQLQFYQKTVANLSTSNIKLSGTLPALNALQKTITVFHHVTHPWLLYFGFYTPFAISNTVNKALHSALHTIFMPRVAKYLATLLQQDTNKLNLLYSDLRAYLALNLPDQIQSIWIKQPIIYHLKRTLQSQPELLAELSNLLSLATRQQNPAIPVNYTIIANSRRILRKIALPQRTYWLLQQKANLNKGNYLDLNKQLNSTFTQIFVNNQQLSKIPYLYTYAGFKHFYNTINLNSISKIINNDVILGLNNYEISLLEKKQLLAKIKKLYVTEYLQYWQDILNQLTIIKLQNLDQAIHVLEILTSNQSPIPKLLDLINNNTAPIIHIHPNINKSFAILDRITQQSGTQYTKLYTIHKDLQNLYTLLQKINNTTNHDLASYKIAQAHIRNTLAKNPLLQLHNTAEQLPDPIKRWFNSITKYSLAIILQGALNIIDHKWKTTVITEYNSNLTNRFPIKQNALTEIELNKFAHFFKPGGTLDNFYQKELQIFIDTTQSPWQWKTSLEQTIGISKQTLQKLEYASHIRSAYFGDNNQQPSLKFKIKPLNLDATTSQFKITFGNQYLNYAHGPQQTLYWNWPSQSESDITRITFTDFNDSTKELTYTGNWAWFKMLNKHKIHRTNLPDTYEFTIKFGKHQATIQIITSASLSALNLHWLQNFNLPQQLKNQVSI